MVDRLRHRGPDEDRLWTSEPVSLGHTRLRIIDLSDAGRQPMVSPDGRFVLIYNGEVYNFRELRGSLRDRGHEFLSRTDTEVMLRAWEEWGPEALCRLEGMYAFALWDRQGGRLHLARDRLGIKPVYWHFDSSGTFLFASEVRALLASGLVSRVLDRKALPHYLSQQTVAAPGTLLEGVWMLPPGCRMEVHLHGGAAASPEIFRYWDLLRGAAGHRQALRSASRGEAVRGLRQRLEAAVERHLVSDVPLGAFLSGGVDSTTIVGLMSRASAKPVRTFAVVFDEPGYDDGRFARLAAEQYGTEHAETHLSDEELVASLPDAVAAQDHPSGDGVNTWIVSRAAREAGLTVALSGVGGDELFGGYPSFRRLARLRKARPLLRALPRSLRGAAGRALRCGRPGVATDKIAELLDTRGSIAEAFPVLRGVFGRAQVARLLAEWNGDTGTTGSDRPCEEYLNQIFREHPETPLLARVSVAEMSCYMRDVLLRDTDQMSMAHSLEVRVPFLDRELVEYSLALPEQARSHGHPPKRYLVDAVSDVLPEPVANRPKSGFAMPFDRWMRGPLRRFCEEGLGLAAAHPAFESESVGDAWRGFLAADSRLPWSRLWLLVALGHWLDRVQVQGVA